MTGSLPARVRALERAFAAIERDRMRGVVPLNTALRVEAVGFAPPAGEGDDAVGSCALGALITPWFLNLVRLPIAGDDAVLRVGVAGARDIGGRRFDFLGAHEPAVGGFEACSLFSPVFEFVDHAAARATAQSVLDSLRGGVPTADRGPQASRRGFLFGRGRSAA